MHELLHGSFEGFSSSSRNEIDPANFCDPDSFFQSESHSTFLSAKVYSMTLHLRRACCAGAHILAVCSCPVGLTSLAGYGSINIAFTNPKFKT